MTVSDRLDPQACPDAEQLAAYADGALGTEDRAVVEGHLVYCADCRHVLAEIATFWGSHSATHGRASAAATAPFRARLGVAVAVTGLATAALLLLSVRTWPSWWQNFWNRGDSELVALVAAAGEERTVEARLTGGFKYGPLRTPTRSGPTTDNLSVVGAAGVLQKAAQVDPSPVNLHAWGIAQLLLGDDERAVENLRDAAAQDSRNGRFQSDLAAALLMRSTRRRLAADLPRALEAAERATELDKTLTEGWFNRALALEKMNLTEAARAAWKAYLEKDSRSKWADEARERLSRLNGAARNIRRWPELEAQVAGVAALVTLRDPNPETAAQLIEDLLLPSWGQGYLRGDANKETLWRIGALARTVSRLQNDDLLSEAVQQIQHLVDQGRHRDLDRLANAYTTFGEMRKAYNATQMNTMGRLADRCAAEFRVSQSPMAFWCDFYSSAGAYYRGDQLLSKSLALSLADRVPARFSVVAAKNANHLGGLAFVQGDYQTAIRLLLSAIDALERAQAIGLSNTARRTLAAAYAAVSEMNEAWNQYIELFAAPADSGLSRHAILVSAGNSALLHGYPRLALHVFATAASEARLAGHAGPEFEASMSLARAKQKLDLRNDARRDFERAERLLALVADAGVSARLRADLRFAQAEFLLEDNPALSAQYADEALKTYQGIETRFRVSQLHRYRARAALLLNDVRDAEDALMEALHATDSEQVQIDQPRLSSSFANVAWDVHRELIRLYTAEGRDSEALLAMEHSRRSFDYELVRRTTWLKTTLADDSDYLVFADLDDAVIGWFVRQGSVRAFHLDATPAALRESLLTLSSALRVRNQKRTTALLGSLYSAILGPVSREIGDSRRLVVIPDGVLQQVPFAALMPGKSRYLVQDVELISARSMGGYAATAIASKANVVLPVDAWVLCDPLKGSAGLEPPAQSRQEGVEVASSYRTSRTSCGEAATQEAFMEALTKARVIHFAGHAVLDPVDPWSSKLVVSPSAGNPDGVLFLRDIHADGPRNRRATAAQVVVLAACSTAVGSFDGRRDIVSLASAFQRLGVPWVLAAEWDIEDAAAHELFTRVHVKLATGNFDPPAALRIAQLALIKGGATPLDWAGVVAMVSNQLQD